MHKPIRHPHFWLTIFATSLGFALVQLDVSIINVALATMRVDLHTNVTGLQWVVDSYALAFASLLLTAGGMGDQIGARKMFIAGLLLFTMASAGCGLAANVPALIAARIVQGIGAACLVPCSLTLLRNACDQDAAKLARAVSLWTAAGGVGLSAGPVLGGILVDALGWRTIFLINLPVGVTGLWLAGRYLEESRRYRTRFDLAGQMLAAITLCLLTGTLIEGGAVGWSAPAIPAALGMALLLGVCFVMVERRSSAPLLPLEFFCNPTFRSATVIGLLINLTLYGMIFVFGLYLQQVRHFSPTWSGMAFLPFSMTLTFSNVVNGWLTGTLSSRRLMVLGTVTAAGGFWLLRGLNPTSSYAAMLPGLLLLPFGVGLAVPAMTTSLLTTVSDARSGVASGVLNTVRQSGGALGVALYGALLATAAVPGMQTAFAASTVLMLLAAAVAAWGMRGGCAGSGDGHASARSSMIGSQSAS